MDDNSTMVTLESSDGHVNQCKLVHVFVFQGRQYGTLIKQPDVNAPKETLLLTRQVRQEGSMNFRVIDDRSEFTAVLAHVGQLAGNAIDIQGQ